MSFSLCPFHTISRHSISAISTILGLRFSSDTKQNKSNGQRKRNLGRRKRSVEINGIIQFPIFRDHRFCGHQSVSRDFQNQISFPELTNSSQTSPNSIKIRVSRSKSNEKTKCLSWKSVFYTHPPARAKSATEREPPRHEWRIGEESKESETPSSAAQRKNVSMLCCSNSMLLLLPGFFLKP